MRDQRQAIVDDILKNYHYTDWTILTGKNINHIPGHLQKVYFHFGVVVTELSNSALSETEKQTQLDELIQIRDMLKEEFDNL